MLRPRRASLAGTVCPELFPGRERRGLTRAGRHTVRVLLEAQPARDAASQTPLTIATEPVRITIGEE